MTIQTNGDDCRESGAGETRRYEMRIIHMSIHPTFRLRLNDGGYVYMVWHHVCGPAFYRDRATRREIIDWYRDKQIGAAFAWFLCRGERA